MPQSLIRFEWRKSNAHLLLLSKFLHPKSAAEFAASDNWKAVLEEDPKQAIKRFMDEGMLAQADLSAQLDYRYKATELKDMLKKRALAISGRKVDLAQRLAQADPEAMTQAVAGLTVLLCSERGRETAEKYVASEKAKRREVERQVIEYLRQRGYKESSETVASYEADRVFPRGMGIDWRHHDPSRDIAALSTIFGRKPKSLSRLNDDKLNALRLAAGMMILWGTNQGKEWLPPDFETGLAMDSDVAVRMLAFQGAHEATIANYRANSDVVRGVEILAAQTACEACRRLSGKQFPLDDVIELPYEHCTSEKGCRCTLLPIVEPLSVLFDPWKEEDSRPSE